MKRSPLRRVSPKRAKDNVQRRLLVKDMLDRFPVCQARIPTVCSWDSCDLHEILTRGRGGSFLHAENILCLCRPCHTYITENPHWALENGFVVHANASLADMVAAKRARFMFHGF